MKIHLYTPVFSLTLLLSAVLLFSVQPMFSKMILPLLGGTPQVWNTAMLFFQVMLLGGYAYAHGTSQWLSVRTQAVLHAALLVFFLFVLPIAIPEGSAPPVDRNPTLWQLSLMLGTVGGPFFVLAASAPLIQRWFASSSHPDADNPYFLYGASNLGSMTALLSYPVLVEPLLTLSRQSFVWAGGYVLLLAMMLACAVLVWNDSQPKKSKRKPANDEFISWALRAKWLILAFIPSSLMLGVTTFITTDIAAVPLLWILPLALYVGTFIIVFARTPIIPKHQVMMAQGFLMIALIAQMIIFPMTPIFLIFFHMALFSVSALACHMELADSRPRAAHLTEFYLIMSLGGALGGVFNAIIAPNYFIIPFEYALALAAACFMRFCSTKEKFPKKISFEVVMAAISVALIFLSTQINPASMSVIQNAVVFAAVLCMAFLIQKRWMFAMAICGSLLLYTPGHVWGHFIFSKILFQDRSFFGVLKVVDTEFGQRLLLHGTTNHGTQSLEEKYRLVPLSYYGPDSPIRDAFQVMDTVPGNQNVAVLGLGIGVTSCFKKPGRSFDFFEIDPKVVQIAENPEYFTFLSDCGSPYKVLLGDARLTIQTVPDNHYDLIVVDVFSSDNIPIHLLTIEAIESYLKKLKKNGVIVFHISNKYLDLEPVLSNAAQHFGLYAYVRQSLGGEMEKDKLPYYPAHYFAMTANETPVALLKEKGWTEGEFRKGVNLWTDQYSNIVGVIDNKSGFKRFKKASEEKKARESAQ